MSVTTQPAAVPESSEPSAPVRETSTDTSRLYRTVWRWHFYAGLLVVPVVFVAAVTGALYTFRAELEPWLYSSMMQTQPPATGGTPVSYEQQRTTALQAAPADSRLSFIRIPGAAQDRTTLFYFLQQDNSGYHVYVDPWTGAITGSQPRTTLLFDIILRIHRRLFAGTFGRTLVELATSWGIVLVATGLYLWWPRGKNTSGGVWKIRTGRSLYMTLRDLHAVPAALFSAFFVLIMVTGLFFSNVWGNSYRAIGAATGGFPKEFLAPPQSTVPEADDDPPHVTVDEVVQAARDVGDPHETLSIIQPATPEAAVLVSMFRETGASLTGQMYLDQYSGKVLHVNHGGSVPAMTTIILYALPIHQGSIFGLPTKILAFLSALVLTATCVTGVWMWWKRRPTGGLGLPARYDGVRLPLWMKGLIVGLCLFLPMAGVSLVVVLLADWLIGRYRSRGDRLATA